VHPNGCRLGLALAPFGSAAAELEKQLSIRVGAKSFPLVRRFKAYRGRVAMVSKNNLGVTGSLRDWKNEPHNRGRRAGLGVGDERAHTLTPKPTFVDTAETVDPRLCVLFS
jgi:hypothetical protein